MDAAKQQLRTALELWFADRDPVSVLTLAASAHQIVHDLNRRNKGPELLFDSNVIKPEQKKQIVALLKSEMNFFKHADKGKVRPTDIIEFDPTVRAETFFFMTINGLLFLGSRLGDIEIAFMVWLRLHRPDWLNPRWNKNGRNSVPVDVLEKLKVVKRAEFLECFFAVRRQT